ncbi:MAG: PLP-dependent aminotransferase family protein [Anaerolineaceae bacterium]|jgi:2-aminoadipate transaminase|nr:MAG: PLP-dependent aminotransferase family protein [Anaerolineaceae bacterium]
MATSWDNRFAQRTQRMKGSAIRELLKFTEEPDVISFAGGMPAPEAFPIKEFTDACMQVLEKQSSQALQYGSTDGYYPLRDMIAQQSKRYGIEVTPENILITSGSQQALDLLGKIFINPGDHIVVENPTYVGAMQAWNAYGAEYIPVPFDEEGMITSELEKSLRSSPKFIYVLPNFQNPTGVTLSFERRLQLIELSEKYGVPIIEDDPYGQLRFEGENLPAIEVLDSQTRAQDGCYSGNVIYTSTFSKTLSPGIRLAWVIAPPEVIQKMIMAKQGTDLHTATFNQMVAYEVGKDGYINEHVKFIRKIYRERRDVMLDTLEEHMPEGVKWTHPQGGLFLWLTLPECVDSRELLAEALKLKVAFVPGDSFFPNGGHPNTMRLNFSYPTSEKINEGISRLAKAIKQFIVKNSKS